MHRRIAALAAALLATLFAASACGGLTVTDLPSASPTKTAAPTGTGTGGVSPTPPPSTATTYPTTAQAYGEKTLAAWGGLQVQALADLMTPDAHAQLNAVPLPPNQKWNFQSCDGAAGSSYCSFASNDGDVITLRMVNTSLGRPHAVAEVKFDPTVYATDAGEYVRTFIEAWRNANTRRMLALSTQTEVDYFTHYTPPEAYSVCGVKAGDAWSVRIYNVLGVNYVVHVADPLMGTRHAITGHLEPAPGPPICS